MVDFVEIYNSSNSFDEVVERTGLSHRTVQQYAGNMRKLGIELKKFERKKQEKIDLELLVSAWNSSDNLKEVIEKTKYSFNTIIRYISLLRGMGVDLKPSRKFEETAFVEAWQNASTVAEIQNKINLSIHTIKHYANKLKKKHKLKEFGPRISVETFVEAYTTFDTISEVAEMLNVTPNAVWLRKERLNKKGYNLKNLKWGNKISQEVS